MVKKMSHEFTVIRREPMPSGSLSSWQWRQESRLSRLTCYECDAPGSSVTLGTLERVNMTPKGRRFSGPAVVEAVCLPCARELIARDSRPGDEQFDWRVARGAIPWQPGDELPEDQIRRIREEHGDELLRLAGASEEAIAARHGEENERNA